MPKYELRLKGKPSAKSEQNGNDVRFKLNIESLTVLKDNEKEPKLNGHIRKAFLEELSKIEFTLRTPLSTEIREEIKKGYSLELCYNNLRQVPVDCNALYSLLKKVDEIHIFPPESSYIIASYSRYPR